MDHTLVTLQSTPYLPLPRSSPDWMNSYSTSWWRLLLIYRPCEDERLSWPCWLMVYPYKWLPISCRFGADQWKFTGQRPMFYHWATQPSGYLWL